MTPNAKPATFVRFSDADYSKIQKDKLMTGQSIPALLKKAYFKKDQILQFFTLEEKRSLRAVLKRITESLDIIRNQSYSGRCIGFDDPITELSEQMGTVLDYLNGKYIAVSQTRK